jgi:hypothetical protein
MGRDDRLELLATAPHHDDLVRRPKRLNAGEEVLDHRAAGERVKHLVKVGLHPGPLAGGENYGGDGPGAGHGRAIARQG